jgi:hypothetical protein
MKSKTIRKKILSPRNIVWITLLLVYVVMAVREQLSLPPEERTWHGSIAGIPYDFRVPTIERLRATVWNKDNPQLLAPQAFGIGWTFNLYPILHPRNKDEPATIRV